MKLCFARLAHHPTVSCVFFYGGKDAMTPGSGVILIRTTADTKMNLLGKVVAHARDVHGITEITPELPQKVASVIHDTAAG